MSHPLADFFSSEEGQGTAPSKIVDSKANTSVSHPLGEFFKPVAVSQSQKTPKQKAFHENVEEPLQIFAQNAVAGFKTLPRTAYEVGKGITDKLGTDVGFYSTLDKLPESVKGKAAEIFPTFQEVRKKQLEIPGTAQENTPFRKGLGKVGRGFGETPYFGGIGGIRGASAIFVGSTAAQVGEELDLNPYANAALSLGGAYLGHKLPGLANSRGATLATQRITPEVQQYMDASQQLGIDPLLTGMNPTQLQRVAQKWATHGIGGPEILQQAYESRSGQVARAFEQALDEAGQNLFTTKEQAGSGLVEGIQDATQQVERNKSQLYRAVDAALPQDAMIQIGSPSRAQQNIVNAIGSLNDTLTMAPPQSSVFRRAEALLTNLQDLTTQLDGDIPVRTLEGTNRALNDIIRYDRPGGADKMLIPFANDIRRALDNYARTNPQYRAARRAANDYFANDVVHIRQNLLQSIARSERPESTLATMNTVSGVRNVERALQALPHGTQLSRALKRYKLNELLRDKIIDPSTGLMKVGGLKNFLSKKSSDHELIRELAGPRAYRTLQLLEHAGQGLERGFNNLLNPSRTADTLLALNSILSPGKKIISGLDKLVKGNVFAGGLEAVLGASQTIVPRAISRMILDPDFARRVYTLSQAARQNNWQLFNQILDSLDRDLKKDDERYDEYLNKRKAAQER